MAGGQALEAARTPAFTFKPDELVLVTEPGERFYSGTIDDPIDDADVMDIAVNGVLQSIRVRKSKRGPLVTAGRQRTKRALVVNALTGVAPYRGSIGSVRTAVERLKKSPVGARITEIALKKWGTGGVMIRAFAANAGSDAEEEMNGVIEDELRRGGSGCSWQVRAQRARQLVEAGQSIDVVAAGMKDITATTLKRWLKKLDTGEEPVAKKARGPSSRPAAGALRKVLEEGSPDLSPREMTLLRMTLEGVNAPGFVEAFPVLATALAEAGS